MAHKSHWLSLQLQPLLRSIKRVKGSSPTKRLSITIDLLMGIQRALDLNVTDCVPSVVESLLLGFLWLLVSKVVRR